MRFLCIHAADEADEEVGEQEEEEQEEEEQDGKEEVWSHGIYVKLVKRVKRGWWGGLIGVVPIQRHLYPFPYPYPYSLCPCCAVPASGPARNLPP